METSLDQIFHYYAASVCDRQRHLGDVIGAHDWEIDMDTGKLSFGPLQVTFQILGTEAEGDHSWLWSWANAQSGLPEHLTSYARRLRDYGNEHGITEFTDRSFPLEIADGHTLSVAAAGLTNANAYYRCPYPGGALFALISDPQVGAPDGDRLRRLVLGFPQALGSFPIIRHDDALFGYAATLELSAHKADDSKIEITDGQQRATATFDTQRRLVEINSSLGSA